MFLTEEITSEIMQWTNVEISINRQNDQMTGTFKDTNLQEI